MSSAYATNVRVGRVAQAEQQQRLAQRKPGPRHHRKTHLLPTIPAQDFRPQYHSQLRHQPERRCLTCGQPPLLFEPLAHFRGYHSALSHQYNLPLPSCASPTSFSPPFGASLRLIAAPQKKRNFFHGNTLCFRDNSFCAAIKGEAQSGRLREKAGPSPP